MAKVVKNRWAVCEKCPVDAFLPLYIKNPSLFSGTLNNPGSLVTNHIVYSQKVKSLGRKKTTIIVSVPQRRIAPLSNQLP